MSGAWKKLPVGKFALGSFPLQVERGTACIEGSLEERSNVHLNRSGIVWRGTMVALVMRDGSLMWERKGMR